MADSPPSTSPQPDHEWPKARKSLEDLAKPFRDWGFRVFQDRAMTLAAIREARERLERSDPATALLILDAALEDSEWRRQRFDRPV